MWGTDSWGEMLWGGVQAVPLMGPFGFLAMALCFLVGGWVMQSRHRTRWLTHLTVTALLVVPLAAVAAVTLPHSFTDGTVAEAEQVNANFDALVTEVNSLTHVWGQVDATGAVVEGTGFTSTRLSTGRYQITYDTPFSGVAIPVVTPGAFDPGSPTYVPAVESASAAGCVISMNRIAQGLQDLAFYLVVVGP